MKKTSAIGGHCMTHVSPAIRAGWKARFKLLVVLPEDVPPQLLREVLTQGGKLIGLGHMSPDYGRFKVESFQVEAGHGQARPGKARRG